MDYQLLNRIAEFTESNPIGFGIAAAPEQSLVQAISIFRHFWIILNQKP
jgi:hypothetical protein